MSHPMKQSTEIPEETVRVAQASFRKGTALMRLRDECGPLFGPAGAFEQKVTVLNDQGGI